MDVAFAQVLVLAGVQGVTEFLPVSSSGHLVIAAWLLGWEEPGLPFSVAVHVGTLVAVVAYFRREWLGVVRGLVGWPRGGNPGREEEGRTGRRMAVLIALATVPAAVLGVAARGAIAWSFASPWVAAWLLVGTGAVLLAAELVGTRARRLESLGLPDAGVVGLAQALSLFPGVSRSGITLVAGMMRGLTRDAAARFSFLMAAPIILGAGVFEGFQIATTPAGGGPLLRLLLGAVVSGVVALAAIRGFLAFVSRAALWPFAAYCGVAGGAVALLAAVRG